jgi:hypothetical protein
MAKNYCETHHLFYSTMSCPCCIADKAQAIEKRLASKNESKVNESVDLTFSLKALQEKVNSNKK